MNLIDLLLYSFVIITILLILINFIKVFKKKETLNKTSTPNLYYSIKEKNTTQITNSDKTKELKDLFRKMYEINNQRGLTDEEFKKKLEEIYIRKNIKTAIKSKEGLYPHEILVLACASGRYIYDDMAWEQFKLLYGCSNVQIILSSLMGQGYLKVGEITDILKVQSVNALTITCQSFNLKASGKKENIIKKILDNIPENELQKKFPKQVYALTIQGEKIIEENEYIIYVNRRKVFFNQQHLNIWSLNKLVNANPNLSYRIIIWDYMEKYREESLRKYEFVNYIMCIRSMEQIAKDEKDYKKEIAILARAIHYYFSSLNLFNLFLDYSFENYINKLFPYEDYFSKVREIFLRIIVDIFKLKEKLNYSDEELKLFLIEEINNIKNFPFHLFTTEECVKMIFLERDRDFYSLNDIYSQAESRFRKEYKLYF